MPVLEILTSLGLGSLLGMRHALEPDHLAAVSTLVTGERSNYKAALLGACWGLGRGARRASGGHAHTARRCVRVAGRADVDRPRPARHLSRGARRPRRARA